MPTETEDFLAHFGVKGMRWGVRRTDQQLDSAGGSGKKEIDNSNDTNEAGPGKISGTDTRLSADADRFVNTIQKDGHEMSTREIKEALDRYQQVQKYNDLFAPKALTKKEQKVYDLQLDKQLKDLQREMNPPKVGAVKKFASAAGTGFNAYRQVDEMTGGRLNKAVLKKVGLGEVLTVADQLKADTGLKKLQKENAQAGVELNAYKRDNQYFYRAVDAPSLAVGYADAGKRRADTPVGTRRLFDTGGSPD